MTRRNSPLLAAMLSTFVCAFAAAEDAPKPSKKPIDVGACAKVTASARYEAYGYTHVVELKNTCSTAVTCSVWTDVDPAKVTLHAAPGKSESVVTRKGSPSRDVTAVSECKTDK